MAAVMDDYMDAPMDADDVFPCKGCGEILEEGKAFELAGNRWHLDCFRCNTCGTLLDSDANLLLLGDGSLICNNCTYSCSACGNKIEDLAILTGDQAFCATCFRCRNCKRKIENLRYARTSQGIFCMGCHETLMARRRKKSKAAAAAKSREKEQSPMITEKSLPALPPSVLPTSAFSNPRPDPDSDTPNELSPKHHSISSNKQAEPSSSSSKSASRPSKSSPEWQPEASSKQDGLTLPASSYRKNRNSAIISAPGSGSGSGADANDAGDGFLISVGLDTNPAQTSTPKSASDSAGEASTKKKDKEYFSVPRAAISDKRSDSHPSTPHIAFQEKGRRKSTDQDTPQMKSAARNAARADAHQNKSASEDFKLQDAPKLKSAGSRSISSQSSMRNEMDLITSRSGILQGRKDSSATGADVLSPRMSVDSKAQDDEEIRASLDQLARSAMRTDTSKAIARKEVPAAATRSGDYIPPQPDERFTSPHTDDINSDNNAKSGSAARPSPLEDAAQTPPPRADLPDQGTSSDNYMQPRTAPAPPAGQAQPAPGKEGAAAAADSKDGLGSPVSPKLPRWSSGADFSLEEDMARILGNEEGGPNSILRRVSNAVRHGRTGSVESSNPPPSRGNHTRSISETTRATGSPRWPKTPHADDPNGFDEISSPLSVASPESPAVPRRQVRTSEQRMADLERQFSADREIKKRLLEKRKTISLVDLQSDIMVKQLEVLAGYIERAKETKIPVDPRDLEESAIKELVQKLDIVKQIAMHELEQIHEERDHLVEEKEQAVAERDRALMEFEQLSSKNAQLADMNNDLTHQIQERFKSQIGGDGKGPNGLGIYAPPKLASVALADSASITTSATLVPDEDTVVESGPTVVQVRKGQVKKFNWKKGSKTMAQNVAKGVNRAVVAFQNDRERIQQQGMAGDSIGLPYNMTIAQVEAASVPLPAGGPAGPPKQPLHHHQQPPFGFFGKKNNTGSKGAIPNAAFAPIVAEPPSILFGSELAERCEYEHRQIPNVVTRCIEEVELRGMDQEGIYRKTGGNSQINMIKDGFDKSESFDISDPDLDITAITSVLKQYFRRLPTPLLTFEVYERVLESVAIADDAERCVHLNRAFSAMPQSHRDCLEFLMFHLHRVAQREPENLMSPKNLAVVFAPTIMRDMSIEREMTDMHAKNIAVQFVIENTHRIFEDE